MPRMEGCHEVRAWEAEGGHGSMPIIALSAKVMSDVQEKCVEVGFNTTSPIPSTSQDAGRWKALHSHC